MEKKSQSKKSKGATMRSPENRELWSRIRDEFVHGTLDEDGNRIFPSLIYLRKKHNVAVMTLQRLAKKDKWEDQKCRHLEEEQTRVDQKRKELIVSRGVAFDFQAFDDAAKMLKTLGKRIPEMATAKNADNKSFTSAYAEAFKIGKLALGLSTEIIRNTTTEEDRAIIREAGELFRGVEITKRESGISASSKVGGGESSTPDTTTGTG